VLANLALTITDEQSPAIRDWLTWRDIFTLMDILCCCAILLPIVWSIKQVRARVRPSVVACVVVCVCVWLCVCVCGHVCVA
jgi:hypothetical protein